ncbi:zinc finger protein, putative [Babesia microti strain RI]|uniref:Zinc finger protein, putative n=1 Tax=Babesia microti (strain RI) TaxID=1133968 RepID=A0A1N6LY51_BABMR|nr:zinc finger protein, putative [Babesia microti strain RI]SIO73810.1 zinc finger protein, putative [Babesia microti strain RI]|eukprot:XP_021337869.1 zinc finger protein, putative [Babesia microti strain RI]
MAIVQDRTVFPDSKEWQFLEFALQLHLSTSRAKLLQAWDVSLPETVAAFNAKSSNQLVNPVFLDVNKLDDNNTVQDIYRRGIRVPNDGMEIVIGNINFPDLPIIENIPELDEKMKVPPQKQTYQFFLCDVTTGLSLTAKDREDAARSRVSMPLEFESHQIVDKRSEPSNVTLYCFPDGPVKGVLPRQKLYEKFYIYDSSQILARYLLTFEFDASKIESFALPFCEICRDLPATIYCSSDKAKMCKECDESFHAANKFVARHIRVPLNQIPRDSIGGCHVHPREEAKHYCLFCTTAICDSCLVDHRHNNKLDIIPMTNAYKTILQEKEVQEELIARNFNVKEQIKQIEELMKIVQQGKKESEEELYREMENPIKRLEEIIDEKAKLVLAQQNCLHTRHLQLSWASDFIAHMRNTLPPLDFLSVWLTYCRFRKEILDRPMPNKPVYADATLVGSIKIASKQATEHLESSKHA